MRETKRCPSWATVKPKSEFARSKGRSDGLQPYCRACRAELDHKRYEREVGRNVPRRSRTSYAFSRGAWLRSLKAGRPCTDCGRVFDPQVMQWDHLPEFEKVGDVGGGPWLAGRTPEEILREIAKCELVCTNCHTIRTLQRRGWGGANGRCQAKAPHAGSRKGLAGQRRMSWMGSFEHVRCAGRRKVEAPSIGRGRASSFTAETADAPTTDVTTPSAGRPRVSGASGCTATRQGIGWTL